MWGFCAALEDAVAQTRLHEALPDYEARRKRPLLTRDLIALGLRPDAVESLPRCEDLPRCPDVAAAFGCVYVLEGATLGGRVLLPMVERELGLTTANGAAFLASYGPEVTTMWNDFRATLENWCSTDDRRARAAEAAVGVFAALERWL
jgi:heme oxygenase